MALGSAPLHRSVRTGAILFVLGPLAFVAAMIVAQLYYPNYSLSTNFISDLGNTANSPLWYVFSAGIILLGLLAIAAILLLWSTFPDGGLRVAGLGLLLVASVGAIVVGFFPENVNGTVHGTASLVVFLPSGLALLALGASMRETSGWESLRWFSIALGAITLVFVALFHFTSVGANLYPGLFERIVVAPVLLWSIVVGIFLARFPVRAPHWVAGLAHVASTPRRRSGGLF
ncbi:MAG: DUF998 domain-containing protein [Thermoplasmata archaeon]